MMQQQLLCVGMLLGGAIAAAQELPNKPGKELFQTICSECHDPAKVLGRQMTKSEWQAKVTEMLQEAPDVTQAERETIVNYLAASFPKKVNVNTAPARDLRIVLEISDAEAAAIVRYREEKGKFKSIEDLRKALDPAKVDAKRDLLEF
jgi:competence protein ComEA